MRKRILKYSIWIVVLLFGVGLYSLNADYLAYTSSLPELELLEAPEDTIPPRYPVAKTTPAVSYTHLTLPTTSRV